MTLESLARTIAKARYGTDAHWAAMLPAAEVARAKVVDWIEYILAGNVDKEAWEKVIAGIRKPRP